MISPYGQNFTNPNLGLSQFPLGGGAGAMQNFVSNGLAAGAKSILDAATQSIATETEAAYRGVQERNTQMHETALLNRHLGMKKGVDLIHQGLK